MDQVAINNISEEEPRSRSPIFTSCDGSGGLVLRGQEVAHWSNKRTTTGPNEEAFQASVRRHLGQGRRRGGGARGDENWRIQLNFFHSRFFMCFLVKVATFTFG